MLFESWSTDDKKLSINRLKLKYLDRIPGDHWIIFDKCFIAKIAWPPVSMSLMTFTSRLQKIPKNTVQVVKKFEGSLVALSISTGTATHGQLPAWKKGSKHILPKMVVQKWVMYYGNRP